MPIDKHTPGPWYAVGDIIYKDIADRRYSIADVHHWSEETEANAQLISAAPDMLRELQIAFGTICCLKSERFDNPEHEADFNNKLDGIYAAIFRAKGRA